MNGPLIVNATSCARCGNWHDWLKDDATPCCDECGHVAATPPVGGGQHGTSDR